MVILLYHGVTRSSSKGIENYSGKHLPEADFAKQMRWIRDNSNILSMEQVVRIGQTGSSWPEPAVAVTFDDGFRNNLEIAAPCLQEYQIPATFYVCPGVIDSSIPFWVDQVEDCLNRTKARVLEIGLADLYSFELSGQGDRIKACEIIKNYCKQVEAAERERVLEELKEKSGIEPSRDSAANYEVLGWSELRELSQDPLFTIGGHSWSHGILSCMSNNELEQDIEKTLKKLKTELGKEILHFSYPEGQAEHYNERVIRTLRACGVSGAPSAIDGVNGVDEDLFHLRRIMPGFRGRQFPVAEIKGKYSFVQKSEDLVSGS